MGRKRRPEYERTGGEARAAVARHQAPRAPEVTWALAGASRREVEPLRKVHRRSGEEREVHLRGLALESRGGPRDAASRPRGRGLEEAGDGPRQEDRRNHGASPPEGAEGARHGLRASSGALWEVDKLGDIPAHAAVVVRPRRFSFYRKWVYFKGMNYGEGYSPPESKSPLTAHYYGDAVRRLFLLGGIIMILTLPFFSNLIPVSGWVSLFAIIVVGVVSGLTNPMHIWVAVFNLVISVIAFAVFEYYAVLQYLADGNAKETWFFLTNQALALIFFVAIYYATKTLRGDLLRKKDAV